MSDTYPRFCRMCGGEIAPARGRPPDFCRPKAGEEYSDCARLHGRFQEMKDHVAGVVAAVASRGGDRRVLAQNLMKLRANAWREVNQITNRGRLVGAPGRKQYDKKRSGWWRLGNHVTPPGMYTIRISAYSDVHESVFAALAPHVRSPASSVSDDGFLMVSGDVSDPQAAEAAARNAGAFSVVFLDGAPHLADEVTAVAEDGSPLPPSAPPEVEAPFSVAFRSPDEGGIRFIREAAGLAIFAEPPTRWVDGKWFVFGRSTSPSAIRALASGCGALE